MHPRHLALVLFLAAACGEEVTPPEESADALASPDDGAGSLHFYTTSIAERDNAVSAIGYTAEGMAAFVYKWQVPGTEPLHRLYAPNGRHFERAMPDFASRKQWLLENGANLVEL